MDSHIHIEAPKKRGEEKIGKTRPTTVYRQAVRTLRKAAELVSKIDGCDEVRAQLVEAAELVCRKMDEMKAAKKAGKKKAKADEAKSEDALG